MSIALTGCQCSPCRKYMSGFTRKEIEAQLDKNRVALERVRELLPNCLIFMAPEEKHQRITLEITPKLPDRRYLNWYRLGKKTQIHPLIFARGHAKEIVATAKDAIRSAHGQRGLKRVLKGL